MLSSKTSTQPFTSAPWLPLNLPAAHLAVHDGGVLKVCQEIFHLIEGLAIPLHHAIVGWHKRPQGVTHQLLQAVLLILTETLQNPTIFPCLKVPCKQPSTRGSETEWATSPCVSDPGHHHLAWPVCNTLSPSLQLSKSWPGEHIWISSNEVDEPRAYYIEVSQKEKYKYCIRMHIYVI